MQTALVAGLHIAAMSAGMQATMMTQALNVARGSFQQHGIVDDVEYEPASVAETTMRAHRLVGEIMEHCDEISRRTAAGGEAAERQQRARRTLQRMQSSPTRQVGPRHAEDGHAVDREVRRDVGGGRAAQGSEQGSHGDDPDEGSSPA